MDLFSSMGLQTKTGPQISNPYSKSSTLNEMQPQFMQGPAFNTPSQMLSAQSDPFAGLAFNISPMMNNNFGSDLLN